MNEDHQISSPGTERSLLGSILLGNDHFYECGSLSPQDFSLSSHQILYRLFGEMLSAGRPVDLVTLMDELSKRTLMQSIGGAAYVADLTTGLPRRLNVAEYVNIVREKSKLRQIVRLADAVKAEAYDQGESSQVLSRWDEGMEQIFRNCESGDLLVRDYLVGVLDGIERESKRTAGLTGLSYGVPGVDDFTDGMKPGEVTTVGARSSVGKTTLWRQAAVANCSKGIPVHLFSFEMTRDQILRQILSQVSRVPFFLLRDPRKMAESDKRRIRDTAEIIADWPLRISDGEMNITEAVALAKLSIRKYGTRFVGFDYAQIIPAEGKDERIRVTNVSRQITAMVKHEECSAMLLSQLRKQDKDSYAKPPHISDLRETGQLENDAHVVLLLHRPWDDDAGRIANTGEILVPKQRNGMTGVIPVVFNSNLVTFEAAARKTSPNASRNLAFSESQPPVERPAERVRADLQ